MNDRINKPSQERIAYLDALRILCSFLVIVNHTYNYVGLDRVSDPVRFILFLTLFVSKMAVPAFLMISGYTLLTKTDSISKSLTRFVRIAVVLVVFSFFYEAYSFLCGNMETLSVKRFLHSIYQVRITPAYWYLYMYAGLLLMVPFLQRMVKGMSRSDFLFFFAISFFFIGLWPMIVEYTPVSEYCPLFELPLFGSSICYLLLGYFIAAYGSKIRLPAVLLLPLWLVCIVLCAAATQRAYIMTNGANYLFLDNISLLPIMIAGACFFSLSSGISLHGRAALAARWLGSHSFGVYLLGDLSITILIPWFYFLRDALHPLAAVTLYQICCWLFALLGAVVLKRIPLIRNLL